MLELLGFCPPLGQFTVCSTEFSGSDLEVPPLPRPLVTAYCPDSYGFLP